MTKDEFDKKMADIQAQVDTLTQENKALYDQLKGVFPIVQQELILNAVRDQEGKPPPYSPNIITDNQTTELPYPISDQKKRAMKASGAFTKEELEALEAK